MTLRQTWVRVQAVLRQPDSPLVAALRDALEKHEAERKQQALDDTERMMTGRG